VTGKAEPGVFVIFGATGDLTRRKLLPAVYRMRTGGLVDCDLAVLGVARRSLDDEGYREIGREALVAAGLEEGDATAWCDESLFYHEMPEIDDAAALADRIETIERERGLPGNRTFYLSLPPELFEPAIESLGRAGLARGPGWTRLVIEKPFGRDLDSARELNRVVHQHFEESQIYRIDHYLGKETVQNLLVFRFSNAMFESLWNREHVESVQIVVAEDLGVGTRAGYYDRSGALRDMVQNHIAQLLSLVAMEVPGRFLADDIRYEKIKVLRSARPIQADDVIRGRYGPGRVGDDEVAGYLDEEGVDPESRTETFVSLRLFLESWRWQGVPFYLRTGKRLPRRLTEVAVTFRHPPVSLFDSLGSCRLQSNVLVMTLQPDEGFQLHLGVKAPGEPLDLRTVPLSFSYADEFERLPDAYETLLHDVLIGDQTLFVHAEEAEASWALFTPLLESDRELHAYPAGTWGPEAAQRHFARGAPERTPAPVRAPA
jgi:glucose-6-phosphate 1-dehydrogenase